MVFPDVILREGGNITYVVVQMRMYNFNPVMRKRQTQNEEHSTKKEGEGRNCIIS